MTPARNVSGIVCRCYVRDASQYRVNLVDAVRDVGAGRLERLLGAAERQAGRFDCLEGAFDVVLVNDVLKRGRIEAGSSEGGEKREGGIHNWSYCGGDNQLARCCRYVDKAGLHLEWGGASLYIRKMILVVKVGRHLR